MKETLVELCYSHPHLYRLCDKVKCIPYQQKCPCKVDSEFQCPLGNCIPLKFRCDGIQHCMYSEDEKFCHLVNTTEVTDVQKVEVTESNRPEQSTSEGLSLPVMVTVVSFSVFILILLFILFCFYITSRQTKNTSKESQSEPLREIYLTADVEDSDSSDQSRDAYELRTYLSTRSNRSNHLQMNVNNFHSEYQMNIHEANDNDDISSIDNYSSADNENVYFKGRNMAINPDVEIYNSDVQNKSRTDGLGKYMFKPTLNYMRSKSYQEIDEADSDRLSVRNNYKKCLRKNNVPTNSAINKEISFKFASGLLCSSTPRQSHKKSVSYSDVSDV